MARHFFCRAAIRFFKLKEQQITKCSNRSSIFKFMKITHKNPCPLSPSTLYSLRLRVFFLETNRKFLFSVNIMNLQKKTDFPLLF